MNKEKLHKSLDEIRLTEIEKEKMLNQILFKTAQVEMNEKVSKFETIKNIMLNQKLVLSLASIFILAFLVVGSNENHVGEVGPDSMMGGDERLGLNYNQYYYAMIEKPESLTLHPIEMIGTLKKSNSIEDQFDNLTGSFTEGATVWRVEEYNPNFRVVVESNDVLYLCENIGKVDESDFDLNAYLRDARLLENSDEIILADWQTQNILASLTDEEKALFLSYLSSSVFIPYEEIDFDAVSSAEMNGDGIVVTIYLVDETVIQFKLIPSVQLIFFERVQFKMSEEFQQFLFKNFK